MYRKKQHGRLGAALVLSGLLAFTTCEHYGDSASNPAGQVVISGITKTKKGKDPYKIFVQFSEGISAESGYVAKGDALINGKASVTIELKDPSGRPWIGAGTYNIAIVLSPRAVTVWEDIDVYGGMDKTFSSSNRSFVWAGKGFLYLNGLMSSRVKEIFDGGDTGKPGIICVPESGIDYPGKPVASMQQNF
jgi:hypothetical protein